jgi:radical SAM protein with 4Fe4S-binding SPASM domain
MKAPTLRVKKPSLPRATPFSTNRTMEKAPIGKADAFKKQGSSYQKHHSFMDFFSKNPASLPQQKLRILKAISDAKNQAEVNPLYSPILNQIAQDLGENSSKEHKFQLTQFIADELGTIDDRDLTRYLYHRYRYDVFPLEQKLDSFPPYLQIEPSSICNYRCVFCYQTDASFTDKSAGHMGTMSFEMFRDIVDQSLGKVEFISLASRGEPLVCKDIGKMLEYTSGKFLGLKINTNASLLNEKHVHTILSGGIKTVVFSADAAKEPLYSKLRVNGSLDRVAKNIEMFQNIRAKEYGDLKVLTRVSGVRVDDRQDMSDMGDFWGSLVDQIAFVKYNPWENVYATAPNDMTTPCSDLWRRTFVWFDGRMNPCDTDYKSTLAVGNILEKSVSELWLSPRYESLRKFHAERRRQGVEPCRRCSVV